MLQGEITFDRVVRWVLTALGFFVVYTLLDVLSGVLWQFFLAWVLAYFTYPLVVFLERRCRIRWRVVSILVAMLMVLSLVALFVVLTVPPMVREVSRLTDDVLLFVQRWIGENNVYEQIQALVQNEEMQRKMMKVLEHDGTLDAFRYIALQAWELLSQTAQILIGVVNVFVVFLYFVVHHHETFGQKFLLVGKGFIESPLGYVQGVGNVVHRNTTQSAAVKQLRGGFHYPSFVVFRCHVVDILCNKEII